MNSTKDDSNTIKIVIDQAHKNALEIETSSYSDFIEFLFQNFQVGKITKEITYEFLKDFNLLIIGNPQNSTYNTNEIYSILEFIKKGGNLLLFSDEGGDIATATNLNELTTHLGYKILPNIIFDSVNHVEKVVWPIFSKFSSHPVVNELTSIVFASGCSFKLLDTSEFTEFLDVSIKPLIIGNLMSKMKIYNDSTRQWDEVGAKDAKLAIAGSYHKGRFIAVPTCSILSSLNSRYGWAAKDNKKLIGKCVRWLLEKRDFLTSATVMGDKVDIQLRLDADIFKWFNSAEMALEWGDFSSIVNYSLRYLKKIIEEKEELLKNQQEKQEEKEEETLIEDSEPLEEDKL